MIGDAGRAAERKAAQRRGARLTPASGALKQKGDMKLGEEFLIEDKSTSSSVLPVRLTTLQNITRAALAEGRRPALGITFTTGDGEPIQGGAWVAIPEWLFREIVDG